ncbi:MAG: hypothetical protein U5J62_09200 [Desulfurivibrio sp.]|nr:hypothetical protein [Desulfurivibrio sp.]
MIKQFTFLLASVLPATLLIYFMGAIFLKKLKLTTGAIVVGFFAACFFAVVVALLIADQPTVNSAMQSAAIAAFVGSVIASIGIAMIGKRKTVS